MGEYVLDRVVTSCSGNMTTHFATDVSSPCPNPQPSNAVTPFFLLFIRSINNSYTLPLIYSEFVCRFPFRFVFFVFLFSLSFISGFASFDHQVGNNLK